MKDAEKGANARMTVDLEAQTVTTSDGEAFSFEVDSFKKHCLMNGLDDIGLTMEKAASIDSFEAKAVDSPPLGLIARPCICVCFHFRKTEVTTASWFVGACPASTTSCVLPYF